MHKLQIRAVWGLRDEDEREALVPRLVPLLAAIERSGSLAAACDETGHSYRHGWGLLQRGRQAFGSPLAIGRRGHGAALTPLGQKLVWADRRIAARLSHVLESVGSEIEAELDRASPDSHGALRIHASHAFALTAFRDFMARRHVPLELTYDGSLEALAALDHAGCDAAGFHVPRGAFERDFLALYAKWLKPDVHVLVNLVERRQGLIVAPDNPKGIASVADLARARVRFVNRQAGSGTRMLLDLLLAAEGARSERIEGYDRCEFTHAAVAAYIASGMADAGLGVETAARQFHLGFVPLVTERYYLALRRETLDAQIVQRALAGMRSRELRAQLARLGGVDATACGKVEEIGEAFPDFVAPRGRRRRAA